MVRRPRGLGSAFAPFLISSELIFHSTPANSLPLIQRRFVLFNEDLSHSTLILDFASPYQMNMDFFMDNKQRIDLCIHVVNELRRMRGLAYAVCRQMKSAKRAGVLKTLVPGQFKYVNSGKQKVDNILNGIKWISKGGY